MGVVNTGKLEGFEEEVYRATDPKVWRTLHDIAKQIHGPTQRVYRQGRYVEVETTASGSGYQAMLTRLEERGLVETRREPLAPMGHVWRRRS